MDPRRQPHGISPVIGAMLLVGMTVVLSALVYFMVSGFPSALQFGSSVSFPYIRIVEIYDENDLSPYPNCKKSCMVLINEGTKPLKSGDLTLKVFKNGAAVNCNILSLHSSFNFNTLRRGIQRLEGEGTRGETWDPGEEIRIDFNKDTFFAGDEVMIEVISSSASTVIASDTFRIT